MFDMFKWAIFDSTWVICPLAFGDEVPLVWETGILTWIYSTLKPKRAQKSIPGWLDDYKWKDWMIWYDMMIRNDISDDIRYYPAAIYQLHPTSIFWHVITSHWTQILRKASYMATLVGRSKQIPAIKGPIDVHGCIGGGYCIWYGKTKSRKCINESGNIKIIVDLMMYIIIQQKKLQI